MVMDRFTDFIYVFVEIQVLVEPDSEALDVVTGYDNTSQNRNLEGADLVHLLSGAHEQYFRLGWIKTEAVVVEPVVDGTAAAIECVQ